MADLHSLLRLSLLFHYHFGYIRIVCPHTYIIWTIYLVLSVAIFVSCQSVLYFCFFFFKFYYQVFFSIHWPIIYAQKPYWPFEPVNLKSSHILLFHLMMLFLFLFLKIRYARKVKSASYRKSWTISNIFILD